MVLDDSVDVAWARVADAGAVERESLMEGRYFELTTMTEEERRAKLRAMARAECSLSDNILRPFTISRMRVWLTLEPEKASVVAASYDAVMQELPGPMAMRRVALVQSLVTEFTAEEEARLRELAPRVFAGAPSRLAGLERPESTLSVGNARSTRPWWAFWKRG